MQFFITLILWVDQIVFSLLIIFSLFGRYAYISAHFHIFLIFGLFLMKYVYPQPNKEYTSWWRYVYSQQCLQFMLFGCLHVLYCLLLYFHFVFFVRSNGSISGEIFINPYHLVASG